MRAPGRNDRCPCGTGKKLKRCCGQQRGPSGRELAKAFLAEQRRWATHWLAQHELEDLYDIYDEMLLLPLMDVSLQVPLPRLSSPAIERLRVVFADDDPDPDEADAALDAALPLVDTPECRAALARDVIRLTGAGRIDQDVAAAALIQLAEPNSGFLKSSLGESASVAAGSVRTPSGLLVAAG